MAQPQNYRVRKTAKSGLSARTQGVVIENVTPPQKIGGGGYPSKQDLLYLYSYIKLKYVMYFN